MKGMILCLLLLLFQAKNSLQQNATQTRSDQFFDNQPKHHESNILSGIHIMQLTKQHWLQSRKKLA